MKRFVINKRVFKQENESVNYLFLSKERIDQYYYFYNDILIKKGDLLYPSKWIKNNGSTLYPIANFDADDYEYIFYPDFHTIDMQEVLNTFTDIKLEDDFQSLLALDELPASVEKMIREVIERPRANPSIVEAFKYANKDEYIILDPQLTDSNITYECSSDFKKRVITSKYSNEFNENQCLFLVGPDEDTSRYSRDMDWYVAELDEENGINTLKLIYDIEDMIPFTNFKKTND